MSVKDGYVYQNASRHMLESWREWQCTWGVCIRALGCFDILNLLLQTSRVYVYVHLTNIINLFLWLICFLRLPILSNFFTGSSVCPTYEICVSVKRQSPIEGH